MQTRYNAYLTVYLSLVFGIILSLLFVFIEGAAIGAVRAQAELVADLGLDSVFAEYNREILNQYDLFLRGFLLWRRQRAVSVWLRDACRIT